jgi:hypothetical protein
MQADDVLAPERQAEIAELIGVLKKVPANQDRAPLRLPELAEFAK